MHVYHYAKRIYESALVSFDFIIFQNDFGVALVFLGIIAIPAEWSTEKASVRYVRKFVTKGTICRIRSMDRSFAIAVRNRSRTVR